MYKKEKRWVKLSSFSRGFEPRLPCFHISSLSNSVRSCASSSGLNSKQSYGLKKSYPTSLPFLWVKSGWGAEELASWLRSLGRRYFPCTRQWESQWARERACFVRRIVSARRNSSRRGKKPCPQKPDEVVTNPRPWSFEASRFSSQSFLLRVWMLPPLLISSLLCNPPSPPSPPSLASSFPQFLLSLSKPSEESQLLQLRPWWAW